MPEGDTIFRTAEVLRSALAGKRITEAVAVPGPRVARPPALERLVGDTVTAVEPRGKHLLISFGSGPTLHTHLGVTGSWHRYARGERWRRSRRSASVVLGTADHVVACFSPARVELLRGAELARNAALRALGPDLLADEFDEDEATRRLRARPDTAVADALLDQRAVAGIGNMYKSELLFRRGINPWRRVRDVTDEDLRAVLGDARGLLAANVRGGARRTTGNDPAAAGERLWVSRRTGRPCRRCGTPIRSGRQGELARSTYWCPGCQSA
ncbi:MAG: Fpg/Nei family DNA glycosylase [Candidatus Limnocylindria bacterium]